MRECKRDLGGKYCQDSGEDVVLDVIFKTTTCEARECPGNIYPLIMT